MRFRLTPHGSIFFICASIFFLVLFYEIGWIHGSDYVAKRERQIRLAATNPVTSPPPGMNCVYHGTVNDPITHDQRDIYVCRALPARSQGESHAPSSR